jgi:hypothetical protein
MAIRVIDEVGEADPPTALRAARFGLGSADLHETKREKLEALVAGLEAAGVAPSRRIAQEEQERRQPVWDDDGAIDFDPDDLDADIDIDLLGDCNATDDEAALRERFVLETATREPRSDGNPAPGAAVPPPPPAPPAPPPLEGDRALAALVELPRFSDLKLVDGVPTRLADEALYLSTPGTRKAKIEYTKVDAIAVAAVDGLGRKPVLLIDLLLNWSDPSDGPLRAVRLRSDAFDACALAQGVERSSDALRWLAATLAERCGAVPLPDRAAIQGRPFAVYESLASYEREVLQVAR